VGLLDQYYLTEGHLNAENALMSSADWNEDVWTAPEHTGTLNALHPRETQNGKLCICYIYVCIYIYIYIHIYIYISLPPQ
jgi:hypothetical protein